MGAGALPVPVREDFEMKLEKWLTLVSKNKRGKAKARPRVSPEDLPPWVVEWAQDRHPREIKLILEGLRL